MGETFTLLQESSQIEERIRPFAIPKSLGEEDVVGSVQKLLVVKTVLLGLDSHPQVIVVPIVVQFDDHSEAVRQDQKAPLLLIVHH